VFSFRFSADFALRTPIDPATLSRIIRRCTGRSDVSAHSTCVGGVHDAFRLGCDLSSIMVVGRWSSTEMPARYGRRILASRSAAALVFKAFENKMDKQSQIEKSAHCGPRRTSRVLQCGFPEAGF
jgi:hypothetical protein